jgi:hypothetical protein
VKRSDIRPFGGPDRERVEREMIRHISDYLTNAIEYNERGQSYYKCSGRAVFVERLQEFLIGNGIAPTCKDEKGTLNDLRSEKRLIIIFDCNVRRWRRRVRKPHLSPLQYL